MASSVLGKRIRETETPSLLTWLKGKHPIETPDLEYSLTWFKKNEYALETPKLLEVSEKVGAAYDTLYEDTDNITKALGISEPQREHLHDRIDWRHACDKCTDFGVLVDEIYFELLLAIINTKIEDAGIDASLVDDMAEALAQDAHDSGLSESECDKRIAVIVAA